MRAHTPLQRHAPSAAHRVARLAAVALAALLLCLLAQRETAAAPTRTPFDHLTTGFELLGQHRDLRCESCHINAIFKGTPSDCRSCHGIGTAVHATAKPANHILTTDRCEACHTSDGWTPAVTFDHTEARGSCSSCHNGVQAQGKGPAHVPTDLECNACHSTIGWADAIGGMPANHIPTGAPCAQCHTTPGNFALYSEPGVHLDATQCSMCHGPSVANTFVNVTITTTPSNHIPIGGLDCASSGCHSAASTGIGAFLIGAASISSPVLGAPGHATVGAAGISCAQCHETAPFLGMVPSTGSTAGDSRPSATLDSAHPAAGDCVGCHSTAPTFATNAVGGEKPANHIPTSAPCAQCHTTPGNYSTYSITGVHQGVTGCTSCHGPSVANTFANIMILTTPGNHIPIGSLDCNGSGCHSTGNVNPGGFNMGTANINIPTLNVAGHTTVFSAVAACNTCHETAPYLGMMPSTSTFAGDSRPNATLDGSHPTSGDCGGCHLTTPTFASDSEVKPANHIPTSAPCAQCHTSSGNWGAYSLTGVHQGVTGCASCHGPSVANTFANVTIVTTPANHIPIGSLDCNGSGCHSTANVNPGGFNIGTANINSPTLTVAGHATVASAVSGCQTCHQTASYLGMLASTSTTAGDSRPSTALDAGHPTAGDCNGCHTSAPTFAVNVTNGVKPSNHIPTSAPCAQCHTTPGNYAAYVMGATGHAGITSGCATCHADGLSFANMAPPTLVEPPTGATGHIPIGTLACELCHSNTNFTTFSGTVMKHAVVRSDTCETCHEYGMMWKTNTGVQLWTRPDPGHHAGQDCGGSGCHTSRDKRALRPIPRSMTAGAASNAAKPSGHPSTSDACSACHSARAWLPVLRVDHSQVIGTCVSCHNGSIARARPATHIRTSAACSNCHTTNAWMPARFDHTSTAVGSCTSCHDSVRAIGMPRTHVRTSETCSSCHGTFAWTPVKLDHARLARPCASCHNQVSATGMPASHRATRRDCGACHVYPDWLIVRSPPTPGRSPEAASTPVPGSRPVPGGTPAPRRMPRNATPMR